MHSIHKQSRLSGNYRVAHATKKSKIWEYHIRRITFHHHWSHMLRCLVIRGTVSMESLICSTFSPQPEKSATIGHSSTILESCASQDMSSQWGENWHQGKMALRSSGKTLLGLRHLQVFMWQGNCWQSATVWPIGLSSNLRYESWGSNLARYVKIDRNHGSVDCLDLLPMNVDYGSLESWLRNLC